MARFLTVRQSPSTRMFSRSLLLPEADFYVLCGQPAYDVGRGEWAILIGMKALWSSATRQDHL